MATTGIILALISGLGNGLFTTPMKLESRWKWENVIALSAALASLVLLFMNGYRDWVHGR